MFIMCFFSPIDRDWNGNNKFDIIFTDLSNLIDGYVTRCILWLIISSYLDWKWWLRIKQFGIKLMLIIKCNLSSRLLSFYIIFHMYIMPNRIVFIQFCSIASSYYSSLCINNIRHINNIRYLYLSYSYNFSSSS